MPILGQHHVIEVLHQPVDDRDDRVAVTHRQRATRAKIALDIDNEQQLVAGPGLHLHLRRRWTRPAVVVSAARIGFDRLSSIANRPWDGKPELARAPPIRQAAGRGSKLPRSRPGRADPVAATARQWSRSDSACADPWLARKWDR